MTRITREFTLPEIVSILAEKMGAAYVRGYSLGHRPNTPTEISIEVEVYPEHAPRSAAMDWCARELARSRRPPSPDYGAAMWAGIRKSEVIHEVLAAVERKRAEERDTRLRAAERQLQPLGVFAVGAIMAAIREVT